MIYAKWFFHYGFAAAAATIVSGSLAERTEIGIYLAFSFLMTSFIYPVVAGCCWSNDGWLGVGKWNNGIGYEDFAGSGVVHLTGGVAGLIGAYVVGPRIDVFKKKQNEERELD